MTRPSRASRVRSLLLPLAVLTLMPGTALAQRGGWGRGSPRMSEGLQGDGAGFSFCRLVYRSDWREPGGTGWRTDYPNADYNLMFRAAELTTIELSRENGEPAHSIVQATHRDLFTCPFLFASDVGTMELSDSEVEALRAYLEKGGFLWVDDFWGEQAWERWSRQLARILPGRPVEDLTVEHPLFTALYQVRRIPQIPSINFWRRSGGGTSERGRASAIPHLRAVFDDHGRPMVLMSHDTDIADGWEREAEDEEYFYRFSPAAYALGVNILIWTMTH